MANEERDTILARYTRIIEPFDNEEDLLTSVEIIQFEERYKDDLELLELMKRAKDRKIRFLKIMSGKLN
ncbi:MAG: hypothetical protein WC459_03880 [Patescibacteria group bacterium]